MNYNGVLTVGSADDQSAEAGITDSMFVKTFVLLYDRHRNWYVTHVCTVFALCLYSVLPLLFAPVPP